VSSLSVERKDESLEDRSLVVRAAPMISKEPIVLQLRFLQTMRKISSEHDTTTFLPVPIDLFRPFLKGR
jgi:hypothetical protein